MPDSYCSVWSRPLSDLERYQINTCRMFGDFCEGCPCNWESAPEEKPEQLTFLED